MAVPGVDDSEGAWSDNAELRSLGSVLVGADLGGHSRLWPPFVPKVRRYVRQLPLATWPRPLIVVDI